MNPASTPPHHPPPTIVPTTTTEQESHTLAAGLADLLKPGDIVTLRGELGAGKTTFVRGLAQALGVNHSLVSSPTYVIVNEYPCPATMPIRGIIHIDAYRLTGGDDLEQAGWDRLFERGLPTGNRIAVIEWPERLQDSLAGMTTAAIDIEHESPTRRTLRLTFPGSWTSRPDFDLFAARPPAVCPVTGRWVRPTSPTYPFFDAKARDADLYRWIVPPSNDDDGPEAEQA
jgi:tRNA threonylcarbamoyladenosine biosynthesis protein TsaE